MSANLGELRDSQQYNFMEPASRENIDRAWRRESDGMLALAAEPGAWDAPTRAGHWRVRDVIGHLVDTTEAYFRSFDAARTGAAVPDPLGLVDMARYVDEGAQALSGLPQAELLERLHTARDRMLDIASELTDEEWGSLMVPHKYMGPLPAAFYPIFQVVDYSVHSWDIREGSGRSHGLDGEAADLLVPLCFILCGSTPATRPGPRTRPTQPPGPTRRPGVRSSRSHSASASPPVPTPATPGRR